MSADQNQDIDPYAKKLIQFKAKQLVERLAFRECDREDLEQEMTVDLLQRSPKFDPKKATWKTFVSRVVNRKVANIIRYRTAKMRDCRRKEVSLDAVVEMEETGRTSSRTSVVDSDGHDIRTRKRNCSRQEQIECACDVATVLAKLPEHLRKVAERLKTERPADIARSLGIPRASLYDSFIQPIRQAFQEAGLRDYL
jgi:RNA polymerase sigma-70 factor (ECF subfamily)